jgi:DNA-binding response OmpR family regulator
MRSALGPAWETHEVSNGLEAVRLASDEPFDLVIADEWSEPFGAFGLTRELKILAEPPAVLIVLDRADDVWLAGWSGADRWLLQPIGAFDLAEAARELVTERGVGHAKDLDDLDLGGSSAESELTPAPAE